MGPRQKSLGNHFAIESLESVLHASMGPRQKSLGNVAFLVVAFVL